MSADNGIYILQSKDGFRVIHTQCIENLWYWDDPSISDLNPKYILQYFGKAKVIETQEEALKEALRLYNEISSGEWAPPIEYGIVPISGWEDRDFPS